MNCLFLGLIGLVVTLQQFMRARSRDKKLQEEWAIALNSVEDIYEVLFRVTLHLLSKLVLFPRPNRIFISLEIYVLLSREAEKLSLV